MTASDRWLAAARDVLAQVATTQTAAIDDASRIFADSIAADGLVHVFGSGHSRMNTEEMFPRIGSYPGFHPVAELALSNHVGVVGPNGLRQAMYLEKVPGFARIVLQQFKTIRATASSSSARRESTVSSSRWPCSSSRWACRSWP